MIFYNKTRQINGETEKNHKQLNPCALSLNLSPKPFSLPLQLPIYGLVGRSRSEVPEILTRLSGAGFRPSKGPLFCRAWAKLTPLLSPEAERPKVQSELWTERVSGSGLRDLGSRKPTFSV